jgi:thioredoxin reductase (NADPH)
VDQSKASREEYLAYLRGIVRQFDLQVRTFEQVTAIRRVSEANDGARFTVETARADGSRTYHARHVILAIGDMHRARTLSLADGSPVPGADLPHVSHYFDEAHKYFGRKLLIVGGKNSAVEAAIRCHRAGADVAISYRRDQFNETSIKYWLKPEIEWLIKTGAVRFYPSTIPSRITATTVTLESTVSSGEHTQEIPADFVLMLIGYEMDGSLLSMAGVELIGEGRAPALNVETMETNVAGLFVAGTAAAGTQLRFKLFIENCHCHVVRIIRALMDNDPRHINPLAYQRLHEHPLAAES